jgi:hypothetical protein
METYNPPKSPFLKGGLSEIPPFAKEDKEGLKTILREKNNHVYP